MSTAIETQPNASDTALEGPTKRYLVIGAGSSGLAAAKALREYGHEVDVVEREHDIGGNWNYGTKSSRVYASAHMISSKPFTQYPDFPMRYEDPDYLHHTEVLRYLKDYVRHFALEDLIQLSTSVEKMTPLDENDPTSGWEVELATPEGRETRQYRGVVIANGHNWYPKRPEIPGEFSGEIIHSADYKTPDQLRGKRVLVVGAGNSGCDIVVEAAQHGKRALHSTRRGYWYSPKYTFGRPSDQVYDAILSLRLPMPVVRLLLEQTHKLTVGDLTRFGLPKPDHKFLETHPIVNSLLVYYAGHGDIVHKPDVQRFDGNRVFFVDDSSEEVDLVVLATGYLPHFPFVDPSHLNWDEGRPRLYKHIFHPSRDDLAVVGLLQPDSGLFKLAHWQSVAVARWFRALDDEDSKRIDSFRKQKSARIDEDLNKGLQYKDSTRHYFEVHHMGYLRQLRKDVIDRLPAAPPRAVGKQERVLSPKEWGFPARPVGLEIIHRSPEKPAGRPPLLFVHGLMGGAWCFDEHWMPILASRGWDVYALSLRGHGESGGSTGSVGDYEQDVLQVLSRMPEPPVLIGHSLGGLVVQRVLERYPARGGLLLCSAAPDHGFQSGFAFAKRRPLSFLGGLFGFSTQFTDEEIYAEMVPDEAQRYREKFVRVSAGNQYEAVLPRSRHAARAPVAVIGARNDRLVMTTEVDRTAEHYGVEPTYIEAGHFPMLSRDWARALDVVEKVLVSIVEPKLLTEKIGEEGIAPPPPTALDASERGEGGGAKERETVEAAKG